MCVCAVQKDVKGSNTISFFTQIQFINTQKIVVGLQNKQKIKTRLKCNEQGHINADNERFSFICVCRT